MLFGIPTSADCWPCEAGQFIVMILLWAIFLAFQVAKAYVEKCSKQYWLLFGSQVTLLLAATATIVWVQYRHLSHDASTLSPEIRILIQGNDANGEPFSCVVMTSTCISHLMVTLIKFTRQHKGNAPV